MTESDLRAIVEPILTVCNTLIPVMLLVVGAIGGIWCIILGVKYAIAEEPQEHEKAKKALKNTIIGFVLIFVLLIGMQVALPIFSEWFANYAI